MVEQISIQVLQKYTRRGVWLHAYFAFSGGSRIWEDLIVSFLNVLLCI